MKKLSGPARAIAFVRALAANPYLEGELLYLEQIHSPETPTLSTVLLNMTEHHRGAVPHVPQKRARDASSDSEVPAVPAKRHKSGQHVTDEHARSVSDVAAMLGQYTARQREKTLAAQLHSEHRAMPVVDTSGTVPYVLNANLPSAHVSLTLELSAILKPHQIQVRCVSGAVQ